MTPFNILLLLHIVFGSCSLLLGTVILAKKKGDKIHKRIGLWYYYLMLLSSMIAMPLAYMHTNYFLFMIAIFTAYMLLTGRRYLYKKNDVSANYIDWLLALTILLFGGIFIYLGVVNVTKGNLFGIVFIVFGSIGLLFSYVDYKNFKGKSAIKNYGLTTHLQRMIGSYIASVTAFLVVNNKFLPGYVAWLLPTIILVPLIVRNTKKYQVVKTAAP